MRELLNDAGSDVGARAMTPSQLAAAIANDFYEGKLDLSARGVEQAGWSEMPEVKAVQGLTGGPDSGDSPQSSRTVRQFLTFISAVDRLRDADELWGCARELLDSDPHLFDPVQVSRLSLEHLRQRLSDARVSRFHGPDSRVWRRIARTLHAGEGAVAHVVEYGTGDASDLLKDLNCNDSQGQPRYPSLRGQKIGPMWVRIMAAPGGAKVENMDVIPVAVDVQVRKVTENLGVADTVGLPIAKAKPIVQRAWKNAVDKAEFGGPEGIAGTCAALDPALWFYGKHGCGHCTKVRRRVPIGSACQSCQYAPNDTT